ncbi:hypothetical protein HNQ10_000108 [Deinococcus metallilatus]|uniref:Transposase n=1 Tax=Deinococcus metallilatus TaxID=1211322 RepID=A0ABR6MMY2_9DEIO|nr:hypothetical protein [Deinococcus metallilatus]
MLGNATGTGSERQLWHVREGFHEEGSASGGHSTKLLFTGGLQGQTHTVLLATYSAMESDLAPAPGLSALMDVLPFAVLLIADPDCGMAPLKRGRGAC